jgi:hypothetical protein
MADDSSSITQPNAYSPFAMSQWTNPYSNFYGKALPWPSSYAGTPTNALGQPIAQPPGMTLNSTPQQPPQAPQSNNLASSYQGMTPGQQQALQSMMGVTAGIPAGYWNSGPGAAQIAGQTGASAGPMVNFLGTGAQSLAGVDARQAAQTGTNPALYPQMAGGQAAQPQAGAAAAPNNWQQTLGMLANPGHVTTPGATVPQAQNSTAVQPGVLQNFLSNWQPQQSGAGSGFTQNFNSILRGLQAQKGS